MKIFTTLSILRVYQLYFTLSDDMYRDHVPISCTRIRSCTEIANCTWAIAALTIWNKLPTDVHISISDCGLNGVKLENILFLAIHCVAISILQRSPSKFYHAFNVSMFQSFNFQYGKIGRTASEEVVLSFVKSKWCLVIYTGLTSFHWKKTELRPIDFFVFIYQFCFTFPSIENYVERRAVKFLRKYAVVYS